MARWLTELRGGTPQAEIARRTGRSRYAVGRWLSGAARPRVPDFLRLVDALTGRAPELVAALVDIEAVPAMTARYRALTSARRLAFDAPWSAVILSAVETAAYRALPQHRPGWIARRLGIPVDEERRCVEALIEAGILAWSGERLETAGALAVDTRAGQAERNALKAHWVEVARGRLESPEPGDLFFYNLFSVSAEDLDRIRDLQRAYFRQLRAIVAGSEPCEAVALVNLQLVEWPMDQRSS